VLSSSDYSVFYIHVGWWVGFRWGSIFIVCFRGSPCLATIIVTNQYFMCLVLCLRNAPISSQSLSLESWSLGVLRVAGSQIQSWIFRRQFFAKAYLHLLPSDSVLSNHPPVLPSKTQRLISNTRKPRKQVLFTSLDIGWTSFFNPNNQSYIFASIWLSSIPPCIGNNTQIHEVS